MVYVGNVDIFFFLSEVPVSEIKIKEIFSVVEVGKMEILINGGLIFFFFFAELKN